MTSKDVELERAAREAPPIRVTPAIPRVDYQPAAAPQSSKDETYRQSLIRRLWETQTEILPDYVKRAIAEAAQELEGSRVETTKPRCWWPDCKETAGEALTDAVSNALKTP